MSALEISAPAIVQLWGRRAHTRQHGVGRIEGSAGMGLGGGLAWHFTGLLLFRLFRLEPRGCVSAHCCRDGRQRVAQARAQQGV